MICFLEILALMAIEAAYLLSAVVIVIVCALLVNGI